MLRAAGIPIRYKILLAVLLVVTAVVSTITFTMARLFHADKRIYVSDMSAAFALHAAQEAHAVLGSYRDRLDVCLSLLDDPDLPTDQKTAILSDVLSGFRGFVALNCYAAGTEVAAVYDSVALQNGGLTAASLTDYRGQHPLPFDAIVAGKLFVENSTLSERMPTLTVAAGRPRADGSEPLVVAAVIRLDELMSGAARSQSFDIFIVDGRRSLLTHRNPKLVAAHAPMRWVPRLGAKSAAVVREFADGNVDKIGGFAPVEGTDLVAGAVIPKAAAYFASRDLLKSLLLVALALLAAAAVVSMFWSQQLTHSIVKLVAAAREIGKGQFHVNVNIKSNDEVGTLAQAFNQMAGELHARDRALKDAQAQLIQSEKMAAFGQLGAGVAHEVKNPLAGILGLVQLLRRKKYEDPMIDDGLATMEKETRRCKGIIDNLLRFARQERVVFEPVDVGAVVNDAVGIMQHQLALNQVTLEKSVSDALPGVSGNANQLQQVLMNLVLNAQQAMGGKPGKVLVEARRGAMGAIEIRVTDNGPGIPKDIQRRIFEPFFTTKPTGQGTGLGLSVSYGIVQEHKGTIGVESEVGKGTTFVIRLPAQPRPAAAPSAPMSMPVPPSPPRTLAQPGIGWGEEGNPSQAA